MTNQQIGRWVVIWIVLGTLGTSAIEITCILMGDPPILCVAAGLAAFVVPYCEIVKLGRQHIANTQREFDAALNQEDVTK